MYEYSTSFFLSLAFSIVLCKLLEAVSETFSEPIVIQHIGKVSFSAYFFGTILLAKTDFKEKFLFFVGIYSFLYAFYAKVYPYNNTWIATIIFYCAVIDEAINHLNQFCYQYERLITLTNSGFGEPLVSQIIENIRDGVQQMLEEELQEEIYD